MAVVRREGDWRLEKREDGLYEITYQKEVQLKVTTPEYSPDLMDSPPMDTVPIQEVDSYTEAEGLFEEQAHGSSPMGAGMFDGADLGGTGHTRGTSDMDISLGGGEQDDFDDVDLPLGGVAIAFLLVSGLVISQSGFVPSSTVFLIGVAFGLGGLGILGWGGYQYREHGWSEAAGFLFSADEGSSQTESDNGPDTTPPTSEKLKNALIFDRAGQECEWCETSFDHPEVHHIKPRSEGGSNTPDNLIVLCPNCHEKADREAIPRSKLRAKVERLPTVSVE